MKWSSVLSASTLVASALAGPVASKRADTEYVLRISTDKKQDLNGKFLSPQGGIIGIYNGGEQESAQKVTVASAGDSVSLLPVPIGINEHVLGLVGNDGWLEFKDLADPESNAGDEQTYSYKDFKLGSAEGTDHELLWGEDGASPGWVAVPVADGWKIRNFDTSKGAIVTQDYIAVSIYLDGVSEIA